MTKALRVLNPPPVDRVRYSTNFINTAVCELRFPTLLELEATPPRAFQSKIRKDYPHYEPQIIEQVGAGSITAEHRYLFKSKDRHWTISVKSFAISLETTKYVDFEDFVARLVRMLASAKEMIDADFFTRVGLRYINWVPIEGNDPEGWVRDDLVRPITVGVLGDVAQFASRIGGALSNGQFTMRHGLKDSEDKRAPNQKHYLLDFDYFAENVEVSSVDSVVRNFNNINFGLFRWCLGDKALQRLGPGKPKK